MDLQDLMARAKAQCKVGDSIIDKMAELARLDGVDCLKTFDDELVVTEVNRAPDPFAEEVRHKAERRIARTAERETT